MTEVLVSEILGGGKQDSELLMAISLGHEMRILSKVCVYNSPEGKNMHYFSQTMSTVTKLQNCKCF